MATGIDTTLASRGAQYGRFADLAEVAQELKEVGRKNNQMLSQSQKEALDMIFTKIARILCGNPDHANSWRDIAGYASLVEKELNGERL
jgi:hypothetical protein